MEKRESLVTNTNANKSESRSMPTQKLAQIPSSASQSVSAFTSHSIVAAEDLNIPVTDPGHDDSHKSAFELPIDPITNGKNFLKKPKVIAKTYNIRGTSRSKSQTTTPTSATTILKSKSHTASKSNSNSGARRGRPLYKQFSLTVRRRHESDDTQPQSQSQSQNLHQSPTVNLKSKSFQDRSPNLTLYYASGSGSGSGSEAEASSKKEQHQVREEGEIEEEEAEFFSAGKEEPEYVYRQPGFVEYDLSSQHEPNSYLQTQEAEPPLEQKQTQGEYDSRNLNQDALQELDQDQGLLSNHIQQQSKNQNANQKGNSFNSLPSSNNNEGENENLNKTNSKRAEDHDQNESQKKTQNTAQTQRQDQNISQFISSPKKKAFRKGGRRGPKSKAQKLAKLAKNCSASYAQETSKSPNGSEEEGEIISSSASLNINLPITQPEQNFAFSTQTGPDNIQTQDQSQRQSQSLDLGLDLGQDTEQLEDQDQSSNTTKPHSNKRSGNYSDSSSIIDNELSENENEPSFRLPLTQYQQPSPMSENQHLSLSSPLQSQSQSQPLLQPEFQSQSRSQFQSQSQSQSRSRSQPEAQSPNLQEPQDIINVVSEIDDPGANKIYENQVGLLASTIHFVVERLCFLKFSLEPKLNSHWYINLTDAKLSWLLQTFHGARRAILNDSFFIDEKTKVYAVSRFLAHDPITPQTPNKFANVHETIDKTGTFRIFNLLSLFGLILIPKTFLLNAHGLYEGLNDPSLAKEIDWGYAGLSIAIHNHLEYLLYDNSIESLNLYNEILTRIALMRCKSSEGKDYEKWVNTSFNEGATTLKSFLDSLKESNPPDQQIDIPNYGIDPFLTNSGSEIPNPTSIPGLGSISGSKLTPQSKPGSKSKPKSAKINIDYKTIVSIFSSRHNDLLESNMSSALSMYSQQGLESLALNYTDTRLFESFVTNSDPIWESINVFAKPKSNPSLHPTLNIMSNDLYDCGLQMQAANQDIPLGILVSLIKQIREFGPEIELDSVSSKLAGKSRDNDNNNSIGIRNTKGKKAELEPTSNPTSDAHINDHLTRVPQNSHQHHNPNRQLENALSVGTISENQDLHVSKSKSKSKATTTFKATGLNKSENVQKRKLLQINQVVLKQSAKHNVTNRSFKSGMIPVKSTDFIEQSNNSSATNAATDSALAATTKSSKAKRSRESDPAKFFETSEKKLRMTRGLREQPSGTRMNTRARDSIGSQSSNDKNDTDVESSSDADSDSSYEIFGGDVLAAITQSQDGATSDNGNETDTGDYKFTLAVDPLFPAMEAADKLINARSTNALHTSTTTNAEASKSKFKPKPGPKSRRKNLTAEDSNSETLDNILDSDKKYLKIKDILPDSKHHDDADKIKGKNNVSKSASKNNARAPVDSANLSEQNFEEETEPEDVNPVAVHEKPIVDHLDPKKESKTTNQAKHTKASKISNNKESKTRDSKTDALRKLKEGAPSDAEIPSNSFSISNTMTLRKPSERKQVIGNLVFDEEPEPITMARKRKINKKQRDDDSSFDISSDSMIKEPGLTPASKSQDPLTSSPLLPNSTAASKFTQPQASASNPDPDSDLEFNSPKSSKTYTFKMPRSPSSEERFSIILSSIKPAGSEKLHPNKSKSRGIRKNWTRQEVDCLDRCVSFFEEPSWAKMIEYHGPNGVLSNMLADRTTTQLKDKVRNIVRLLERTGTPLGSYSYFV